MQEAFNINWTDLQVINSGQTPDKITFININSVY